MGWLGRCLRIDVNVGNNCGDTDDFTYFRFDGQYYKGEEEEAQSEDNFIKGNSLDDFSDQEMEFQIFPNPLENELYIKFNTAKTIEFDFYLYNNVGKLIKQKYSKLSIGEQIVPIDISNYPSGIYYYQFLFNGILKTGKVIKI